MFYPPRSRARFYGRSTNYLNIARDAVLGRIQSGDDVAAVEADLAAHLGRGHAICMPQARVGIYLVIRALTRTKKKVVLSPYTIHDVINMVICAGAEPVFADIERETCNIDPRCIAELVDRDTAAVMVTHLHGLMCDMPAIAATCRAKGVALIEDASQSFGARIGDRRAGTFGDAGIYSFGMAKNVNSLYGGLVATDRADLAETLVQELRSCPYTDSSVLLRRAVFCLTGDLLTWPPIFRAATYWAFRYGYLHGVEALNKRVRGEDAPARKDAIPDSYLRRMTPMQARLLVPQLREVDRLTAIRIGYARIYHDGLAGIPELIVPPLRDDGSHVYLNYAIQHPERHAVLRYLMTHGRDLTVQHMGNNADYECFRAYARACPNARATAGAVLLLPTYPDYGEAEVRKNVALIQRYFQAHGARRASAPVAPAAAPGSTARVSSN